MFSIVIPVYNKSHTLKRTVDCALRQTFRDFELIVVDDGSTDGSLSVLSDLQDPRLRILTQANAGPGAARNAGAAASVHRWIAFLDADDLWFEDHLAELDNIRKTHPDAGLIGTSYVYCRFNQSPERPSTPGARITAVSYFDAVGSGAPVLHTSTAAVRRDALGQVGGFGDYLSGEDSELWVRLALAFPVATSTRATAAYVRGTGGITETRGSPWTGKPPRSLSDLSPAVATLLARRGAQPDRELDAGMIRYVQRYLYWSLHAAARAGDIEAVRALAAFYPKKVSFEERLLLAASFLPPNMARFVQTLVYGGSAVVRRLSGDGPGSDQ